VNEPRLTMLDQRVQRLHNLQPLPPDTRRSLAQALRTRITYASNAIEGNGLTLAETQVVLEGVTVGGKPLRDHLEAIDHAEAWDAVLDWARETEPLTPHLLRSLQALVLRRSRPDEAGRYRTVPVAIAGSSLVPLDSVAVPAAIDGLFSQWNQMTGHPVVVGAEIHPALMKIHPFVDGNGRTGRLLLNLWLIRHRYPPALLDPADRPRYYAALQAADAGDAQLMVDVIAHGIGRTLGIYEEVLGIFPDAQGPRV
jgi:Fic family protein